jgi:hypothetical protein
MYKSKQWNRKKPINNSKQTYNANLGKLHENNPDRLVSIQLASVSVITATHCQLFGEAG